jgi:23S rRNA pseudouridine2605 synthase
MREERLQKILAAAGVASRRACEELIVAGRVQVNGHTVTELGTKVDPTNVQIQVDGKPVHLPQRHQYIKMHKPRGIISDIGGDAGERQTVADLLPPDSRRLFPVGRLDVHSEGLILLTDDGELAHKLTHPRFQHTKTYYVLVAERPTDLALNQLRRGIDLPEGRTAPAQVRVVNALPAELKLSKGPIEGVWLEIILREGKKRQIRHMTAAVGYPTLRLVRWAIGPLTLGDLKLREVKPLTGREVAALRTLVGLANALPSAGRQSSARGRADNARPARPTGSTESRRAWGKPTGRRSARPGDRPHGRPKAR